MDEMFYDPGQIGGLVIEDEAYDTEYFRHYIRVREDGCITDGWSDGPHGGRMPTDDDICMNEQGGYQFRLLFADGSVSWENPSLMGMDDVPLYRWDGGAAVARDAGDIEAERAAPQSSTG